MTKIKGGYSANIWTRPLSMTRAASSGRTKMCSAVVQRILNAPKCLTNQKALRYLGL